MKKPRPDFDWSALEAIGEIERKEELLPGTGFTVSELARQYGITHQHASTHVRAMLATGTIKRIGYRRDSHGRLSMSVYDLTDAKQAPRPRGDRPSSPT